MVKGDDFEALSKSGDLILPEGSEATEPGNEQDGKTHAMPLVVERAVTDGNPGHRFAAQNGLKVGTISTGRLSTRGPCAARRCEQRRSPRGCDPA